MKRLYTVGYAGHTSDSLVELLTANDVRVVTDVRANPVSRKKGFSKRQLAATLESAGIEYRSLPALGIPSSDRKAVTGGAEGWSQLLADYSASLEPGSGRADAASELADACLGTATAIMCMETDLDHCHRKPLAERVSAISGLAIEHLP